MRCVTRETAASTLGTLGRRAKHIKPELDRQLTALKGWREPLTKAALSVSNGESDGLNF